MLETFLMVMVAFGGGHGLEIGISRDAINSAYESTKVEVQPNQRQNDELIALLISYLPVVGMGILVPGLMNARKTIQGARNDIDHTEKRSVVEETEQTREFVVYALTNQWFDHEISVLRPGNEMLFDLFHLSGEGIVWDEHSLLERLENSVIRIDNILSLIGPVKDDSITSKREKVQKNLLINNLKRISGELRKVISTGKLSNEIDQWRPKH